MGIGTTATSWTQRRTVRALVALAVVIALVAAAVGFRAWSDRRRAEALEAAAAALGSALSSGTLGVGVLDAAPDLKGMLADASDVPHRVEVALVEVLGDRGRARLRHLWQLRDGEAPYAYETDVTFTERDGGWLAAWEPGLLAPGLAAGETLRTRRLMPARADILDAAGQPIVTRRPVRRVGIDRSAVPKDVAVVSAGALARALGVDEAPYVDAVAAAGERAFVPALTLREASPELARARTLQLPGLLLQADALPLAPSAGFARPVLGTVGEATKEIVAKSEGRVQPGDLTGLGGLQASADDVLAGRAGRVLEIVPPGGAAPRRLAGVDPVPGRPVRIGLSVPAQSAAEAELAGVKAAAAIVAIRPSDGHLLAAASGPGSAGTSTATLGQYPPGSTMKVVTALALLRSGLTAQSTLSCPASIDVDGRAFRNYDGYPARHLGSLPLVTAFAQSCNTALIGERGRIAGPALGEAAAALGLTAEPSLGVPAVLGSVPAPASGTEAAASLIGQGRVLSSPLGMATVAASVAAGHVVTPRLVLEPTREAAAPTPAVPLSAAEAASLRELMRAVVTDGNGALLRDVPGGAVAAKSGTAEYGDAVPPRTHAWMIAIQGDLAVAAFVAEGAGGASDAGPIVRAFLTRLAGA